MNSEALKSLVRRGAGALLVVLLTACAAGGGMGNNPSPVAGSAVSNDANRRADMGQYQAIEYANAAKKGPRIIVLPGEIKGANATFTQRVTANNIADFVELELTRANFTVLERAQLGALLREVELAYNVGDVKQAQRAFQKGKISTTRWVVKFDVLKAEPVASSGGGIDGSTAANLLNIFGRGKAAAAGSTVAGSVRTDQQAVVWNVGMRYKILDANTSEQVANGYFEEKMEVGAKVTSIAGVRSNATGGVGLDTLVQRLVQRGVSEIDARHK
ncbi:hypothetical protein [Inhella proteolytica]|uniref:Lipoprotein n=1 Tax=Inhella proteolytica TaxID=2795029 RepID=A0A931J409_9BURK|nr:hypothetical protein [Inhella proteolytica]MBH9575760.1 hypothetical protein [Inhella proteolytica]